MQLSPSGTWVELHANDVNADSVKWYLREFTSVSSPNPVLFHIESSRYRYADLNYPAKGKLYRSFDYGVTWTDVTPSSGDTEYCNAIEQAADNTLWCITDEREYNSDATPNAGPARIYKSIDDGDTWTLSYTVPIGAFSRYPHLYNIAVKPSDADTVVVEGVEMVAGGTRLYRTTDGGSSWTAAVSPGFPSPPLQTANPSGEKQHIFTYTVAGVLVYSGIFETANDDFFILTSGDDGDTFTLFFTEPASLGYGAELQETDESIYICGHVKSYTAPVMMNGIGTATELADKADPPFTADHSFADISRHEVSDVDTLHMGTFSWSPGADATDDPSVYTRPADLSSDWVEHPQFATMNADLGYRLYVGLKGLLGATPPPELEFPVPPRPPEPPVLPGPFAPRGVGVPPRGVMEKRVERLRRRAQRTAVPPTRVPRRRPVPLGDMIDKSMPPRSAAPVEPRKWLTFGWTITAVLNGQKTLTLRELGPVEALQYGHGELFYAYDFPPTTGGSRLALIRLTAPPREITTSELRPSDFNALGFQYLEATGQRSPSGLLPSEVWARLMNAPGRIYELRFHVERLYDQRAPQRTTIAIGEENVI